MKISRAVYGERSRTKSRDYHHTLWFAAGWLINGSCVKQNLAKSGVLFCGKKLYKYTMQETELTFITGNKDKFSEVQSLLGMPLYQLDLDLPELQSLDAKEIVRHKLLTAEEYAKGAYMVEDSSLYLGCLENTLPGPFIKWFEKTVGIEGIASLAERLGDTNAEAKTIVGYAESSGEMRFFEGALHGHIVRPRGTNDFGWGPIFVPDGYEKTFGEMTREEKHTISMRGIAVRRLREFLIQQQ